MTSIINPELFRLAQASFRQSKQAFVAAQDPSTFPGLGVPTQPGQPGSPGMDGPQLAGPAPTPQPGGSPMPAGQPVPMPGGGMDPTGGGMIPPGQQMAPPPPQAQPQQQGGGKPKFDPLMLDHRMYNMQQQFTALLNAMGVQLPPGALVTPPGSMGPPPAEHALPGGPMDPAVQQQQAQQQPPPQGAVGGIEPMQGAGQIQGSPVQNLMAQKQAALRLIDSIDSVAALYGNEDLFVPPLPVKVATVTPPQHFSNQAAAMAAMLRRNAG